MKIAIEHVLKIEGGFVNHPSDRGGPTNFGITQKTLSEYRCFPATVEDVQNMSQAEAEKIYELQYWNTMQLNRVQNKRLARVIFATGVNIGPKSAVKMLQEVLNTQVKEKLTVDGVLGNSTDAAILKVSSETLLKQYVQALQLFYVDVVIKRPEQIVFLKGWLNRTFLLLDF